MQHIKSWAPGPNVRILGVERGENRWAVAAEGQHQADCPGCATVSTSRHSSYFRQLQDLPVQGVVVVVRLKVGRWRCRNPDCERRIFTERLPGIVAPSAQRTVRVCGLVRLIGHSAGGRPAERLMERFGMPVSDTTILRQLTSSPRDRPAKTSLRVVGIDDWAWRKGYRYGTILVDLERRTVVDLLPDRSAVTTAAWLARHPGIEIVSRDRCGLYAVASRTGVPKARQVADRFICSRTSARRLRSNSADCAIRRDGWAVKPRREVATTQRCSLRSKPCTRPAVPSRISCESWD